MFVAKVLLPVTLLCFANCSPHPENLLPKIPPLSERRDGSPDRVSSAVSLPASRNGVTESSSTASTSMSGSKEHGNLPMVMPMIPPPLIKPPAGRWQVPRYSGVNRTGGLKRSCSARVLTGGEGHQTENRLRRLKLAKLRTSMPKLPSLFSQLCCKFQRKHIKVISTIYADHCYLFLSHSIPLSAMHPPKI